MAYDDYYSTRSLILHCDGTDASTTFTDNSATPKTVTAAGNAQVSTAQKKFGTGSCLLDGTGDYLNCGDNAAFEFGSGDFTLECWVRLTGYSSSYSGAYAAVLIGKDASGARAFHWKITGTGSSWTGIAFSTAGTELTVSFTFSLDTWYHVAVCKSGTTMRFFVDGTQAGADQTHNSAIADVSTALTVGAMLYSGFEYYVPGYIDDVRITKGRAEYTADFTAPAEAFPDSAPPPGFSVTEPLVSQAALSSAFIHHSGI